MCIRDSSSEKKVSWKDESESNSKGTSWSGFARGVKGFCQAVPDEAMQHTMSPYQNSEKFNLRDVLVLDSGSTIKGTFCNPDFLYNIRQAEKPMIMSTNGGKVFLNKEGDVPDYGACYIDQKQMANIFGLFHMSKEHRITMDTDIENAFIVHFKDGRQVKIYHQRHLLQPQLPLQLSLIHI